MLHILPSHSLLSYIIVISFSDIAKPFKDAFNLAAEGFDPASGDQGFFKNLKNNLTGQITQVNEVSDLYGKLIVTKKNIAPFLKDTSSFKNFGDIEASQTLNQLKHQQNLVDTNRSTWEKYFSNDKGKEWQKSLVENNKLVASSTEDVKNAQEKGYQQALNFNQSLEKLTIGSKAAAVGMKLLSTAANIGVSMAISAAITAVYKLTQVSKDVANAAQDSANSFNTSKDSLDSYKDKVEELREKMNSSSSSIADVSDARKELLSIQTEMIKKFGDEESSVKAVTDAINGQASAWDVLAKKQWDSSLNHQTNKLKEVNSNGTIS